MQGTPPIGKLQDWRLAQPQVLRQTQHHVTKFDLSRTVYSVNEEALAVFSGKLQALYFVRTLQQRVI